MYREIKLLLATLIISSASSLFAISIGTAKKPPDGFYLLNYIIDYRADEVTDKNKNTSLDSFGLRVSQYSLRPLFYKDNFVYFATISLVDKEIAYYNSHKQGLGDISLAIGYFLPFDNIDMGPVLQVTLPSGQYDKNSLNNIGSGTYAIKPEFYVNKIFSKFMLDAAIKYSIKFENHETGIKDGNEVKIESVLAYMYSKKLMFGPSFTYSKSDDKELNGVKINNSDTMIYKIGADIKYPFNKRVGLLLNVMKDIESKNTVKGTTFMLRVSIAF